MREISTFEAVCMRVGGFFLEVAAVGYIMLVAITLCRVLGL